MIDGIEIIIRGPTSVGKTTVATLIADQLRLVGFPVLEPMASEENYTQKRAQRHDILKQLRERQIPVVITEVNVGSSGAFHNQYPDTPGIGGG